MRGAPAHIIQVHRRVVSQAAFVRAAAVIVLHAVRVVRLDLAAAVVARLLVTCGQNSEQIANASYGAEHSRLLVQFQDWDLISIQILCLEALLTSTKQAA